MARLAAAGTTYQRKAWRPTQMGRHVERLGLA
jgi:hypothetical protein